MKKVLIPILLVVGVLFSSVDVWAYGTAFSSGEYYRIVKTGDKICTNDNTYSAYAYSLKVYDVSEADPEEFELVGSIGTSTLNGECYGKYGYGINFSNLYASGLKEFKTDTFVLFDTTSGYGDSARLYPIYEPTVSIECDKDTISYGETSKCSLKYETAVSVDLEKAVTGEFGVSPNCISSIEFDYNSDDFIVSNYESSEHLKKTDSTFSIVDTSNSCSCTEENVLMTFDVALASEDVETTDLKVAMDDITFSDVRGSAVDSTVSTGNITVSKDSVSNPSTFSNTEIFVAIIVVCVSLIGIGVLSKKIKLENI